MSDMLLREEALLGSVLHGAPVSVPEILLVEDNPGDVLLFRKAVERAGIAINLVVAEDGEEALSLLRGTGPRGQAHPSLVLLDLNLPCIDGREVLRQIKSDPALKRLPVVILTSSSAEDDIALSYEMHANSFICKPANLPALQHAVQVLTTYWFGVVMMGGR